MHNFKASVWAKAKDDGAETEFTLQPVHWLQDEQQPRPQVYKPLLPLAPEKQDSVAKNIRKVLQTHHKRSIEIGPDGRVQCIILREKEAMDSIEMEMESVWENLTSVRPEDAEDDLPPPEDDDLEDWMLVPPPPPVPLPRKRKKIQKQISF